MCGVLNQASLDCRLYNHIIRNTPYPSTMLKLERAEYGDQEIPNSAFLAFVALNQNTSLLMYIIWADLPKNWLILQYFKCFSLFSGHHLFILFSWILNSIYCIQAPERTSWKTETGWKQNGVCEVLSVRDLRFPCLLINQLQSVCVCFSSALC